MSKNRFICVLPLAGLLLAAVFLLAGCQEEPIDDPALPLDDQLPEFSMPHGLMEDAFKLTITPASRKGTIYYSLDGSVPTEKSKVYKKPLAISGTTILRAIEKGADGSFSKIATASYLFEDVLDLASTPEGYPEMWDPTARSTVAPKPIMRWIRP